MNSEPVDERRGQESAACSFTDAESRLRTLLRRSGRGDEAAFAQLYDLLAARVYGLVLRVVRDRAQSEEVVQEAFVDMWRHASRYDPERGSATSWALTMAHRRAVDRVRSSESARRRDDAYAVHNVAPDIDHTSETAERALDAQRVMRALGALTDAQRAAIELAYFGGYTHREVAVMLEVPVGTAKTRIRDGLIRLRDALGVGT